MKRRTGLLLCVAVLSLVFGVRPLAAQADVIRGRVTTSSVDNAPIRGVQVTVTSISGGVNRSATTNGDGRFTVTFPNGDGDYWVSFAAIGFTPRRFEVKRLADESILIADARLQSTSFTLDTIVTTANGDRRRPARNSNERDVSGTERGINPNLLPPDQAGDLAALAATLPGVQFIPGTNGDPSGFSVLGLSTDQNLTTLNGLASGSSDLPRDAGIQVSLSTSPYDVAQGGFSGGSLNIRTQSGSNYFQRVMSFVGNTPTAEWTDAPGLALGQEYNYGSLGARFSGPFAYDAAFYNTSLQLGRRANDLRTLLNTDPLGLETEGVSADSVKRLLTILGDESVPPTVAAVPSSRLSDQGSFLGSFDFAPPSSNSGQALNLTVNGSWNRFSPFSQLSNQLPATSGEFTRWNGSARLRHTTYFGFGVLSETALAFSENRSFIAPFLSLPTGNVLLHSDFADGTSGVQFIQFGGAPFNSTNTGNSLDLSNQLSFFTDDNKHRIKFTSEIRRDGWSQEQASNQLGTFTYNSLADLENNLPASFSRQIGTFQANGSELMGGVSLGDSYRATPDIQVVYGVRADANHFVDRPQLNPAIASTFGLSNDYVPNGVFVSPRLGFSWTYGTASQIGAFFGASRVPRGVIQGGIGLFQNQLSAQLPAGAMLSTGLPSAIQQITCVGAAAPIPDWTQFAADQSSIPDQCVNGTTGTVFVNSAPNVSLFDPQYAPPKSLRSNLQWTLPVVDNRFMATLSGTWSYNMNQTGNVDLNFNPTVRFTLPDEGNRPVYVQPTSIVPTTGAVAIADSRMSSQFNRVTEQRSNLESVSQQLQISLRPLSVNSAFSWSLNYTLNSVQDEVSGFSSTAANPLEVAQGRSSQDWRHQIQANLTFNLFNAVFMRWNQSFQSGFPFTPIVASDINGDGFQNDRAFVANPATTTNAALGSGMTSLLNSSSGAIKDCLTSQLGQIAARNSCEGPWTTSGFVSVQFNPLMLHLPQRATLSFSVANPFGAADLILHGQNNLQGWGQNPTPDSRLLIVHGFDQAAERYTYEVNQRFGSTSQAVSAVRNPVVVTMQVQFDIGPTRERQGITQTLDRGRSTTGARMSEQFLKAIYGTAGILNPLAQILSQADSLKLTGPEADSIATMNRWYVIHLDSLWTPVVHYYATLPDAYDQDEVYERYRHAREASVDLLLHVAPAITNLLTPTQRRKLPDLLAAYLDSRYLAAVRSGTSGSPGGVFAPGSGAPGFGPIGAGFSR